MNVPFIKRVMLVILGFLIIMILLSFGINKGEVEVVEDESNITEGDFIDESELYIVNEADVYNCFNTPEEAIECFKRLKEELKKYGSSLKEAGLKNIECADGILVFEIYNVDFTQTIEDEFRITISSEGTAIERLK